MRAHTPHFLLFSDSRPALPAADLPTGGGRWRFVLASVDGSTQFAAADDEHQVSAERLELLAVVRGLEALDQPSRVTLVTNSQYVRRGIRFGLEDWRGNDWTWESFGAMAPIPHADLWQRVDRALGIHEVKCRRQPQQSMARTAHPAEKPTLAPPARDVEAESRRESRVRSSTNALLGGWPAYYGRWRVRLRLLLRTWRRWIGTPAERSLIPSGA